MKKPRIYVSVTIAFALASLLSSCAEDQVKKTEVPPAQPVVVEPAKPPAPPPETPEQIAEKAARAAAQTDLDSLIALYNNGDYHGEIKHFGSSTEVLKPYKDLELQGLKYTAFSYCLIGRTSLCRQQFEKAVKLDPSFDLLPGEKGHPLWGPVFERVKKKEGSN
jgi:hypothetical protein